MPKYVGIAGVLLMTIPMLVKIDFGAMAQAKGHWSGIGVTLVVNRLAKPSLMALLGWIFMCHVFAPYLPAQLAIFRLVA